MFEFENKKDLKIKLPRKFVFPKCRIDEAELMLFKNKVLQSGLTASEYQRKQNLYGAVNVQGNAVDVEAVKQLKYIGHNLNQLTRRAHIHGDAEPQELKELMAALNRVLSGLI